MTSGVSNDPDIFHANRSYPDAKGLFYAGYASLEQVREQCVVVLDTNALLVPYGISRNSLSQIETTYAPLARDGRLVVPAQVAREFAKNRPLKIAEIFQALSRKRNLASPDKGRYPLLQDAESYNELQDLESQIDVLIGKYRNTIADLLQHIQEWNWNDPVSLLYNRLFPTLVHDVAIDENQVRERLHYQRVNKTPPGYKDAAKDDQGIGDQLIWQTVVDIAANRKQHIVFVSGDTKADWFYRSEGQALFPRFELVDEIRRVSQGQSLHIASFSRFLELFGATPEAIGEVRKEEVKVDLASMSRHGRAVVTAVLAEQAVAEWLRGQYPYLAVSHNDRYGRYVWEDRGGAAILVAVKKVSKGSQRTQLRRWLQEELSRFDERNQDVDNILIFLIFESEEEMTAGARDLPLLLSEARQSADRVVVGCLSSDGELQIRDPLNALPTF